MLFSYNLLLWKLKRHCGLLVSALDCTSSNLWFVLGQHILLSQCLSPRCTIGTYMYVNSMLGVTLQHLASHHFMANICNTQLVQNFAA